MSPGLCWQAASPRQAQQSAGPLFRQMTKRQKVAIAHMELAQPSIAEAISQLAQQGETEVVLVPYFLSPGRHITQDIPALVAAAQEANPGVRCSIAGPIGAPW